MIFVTGDTHGVNDFLKLKEFAESKKAKGSDYVIIAGDVLGVGPDDRTERILSVYGKLPFTVLFVDGNHENYPYLNSFPVIEKFGGKVRVLRENVIHLCRGEIFEIEGNKIFTFGGATSIDRIYRTENVNLWAEETPSQADYENALQNLENHNFTVDYVITHSCDEKGLYYLPREAVSDRKTYLENVMMRNFFEKLSFKKWYFGHFHTDKNLPDGRVALYNKIIPLGEEII